MAKRIRSKADQLLHDMWAFLKMEMDSGANRTHQQVTESLERIAATLYHDVGGYVRGDWLQQPRVSGYERKLEELRRRAEGLIQETRHEEGGE